MKHIINKPINLYITCRQKLFDKKSWNQFYAFVSLPELKCVKTLAFVVSIIL
jgi:hypothetical protein